jgi:4-hydroxy-2-oxoheptanedioate aldolase
MSTTPSERTLSEPTLREQWRNGETTLGGWLAIPSTVLAETTARAGFDYVCVDTQHGAIEYSDAVGLIQAILLGGSTPIVRVPWNEPGIIGKILDAGALGVIVPMVNTVAEAEAVVRAARYAPSGSRSYGPTVVGMRRPDYVAWAAENIAVIPMIETGEALENLDDILAVDGIDAIYVGPADLSLSLGLAPGNNDDDPVFAEAYTKILDSCRRAGVVAGCHASGTLTPRRTGAGFRMVTVTTDLVAARIGLKSELDRARSQGEPDSADALY